MSSIVLMGKAVIEVFGVIKEETFYTKTKFNLANNLNKRLGPVEHRTKTLNEYKSTCL